MSLPKRVVLSMAIQKMIATHPLSKQKNIQSLIVHKVLSINALNMSTNKRTENKEDIKNTQYVKNRIN